MHTMASVTSIKIYTQLSKESSAASLCRQGLCFFWPWPITITETLQPSSLQQDTTRRLSHQPTKKFRSSSSPLNRNNSEAGLEGKCPKR